MNEQKEMELPTWREWMEMGSRMGKVWIVRLG